MNDDELTKALSVVLRDLAAQCPVQPVVRDAEDGGITLYAPDASGWGVYVWPDSRPGARLAEIADRVQDWAVEALWAEGASAVWPPCPAHPDTHPLTATVVEGKAVWACPRSGVAVAFIGELGEL
ncbi:hypothetical protein ACFOZ0_09845 [Streptomyces yaanensis]|uniref:Uncharacterized protein n=1 Tax=Streptomyces yaanensis TaxID=1142239 RepID=A0ABV7SD27_9ACTN|nr:hypothetical protein [Streptomyces sp. CGMCC 4.7035]WNB96659.1 hypothetical protein Q2K21_00435 [Streptomyces sp. CGMCC 4.7035]